MIKMKFYLEQLKKSFEMPVINSENEIGKKRSSDYLELFFDLIFVAAISKISHLFYDPTFLNIFSAIILFFTIYRVWYGITRYNLYFYSPSYLTRFILLISMYPIMIIIGVALPLTSTGVYMVTLGFLLSRLAMAAIWKYTISKNPNINNEYINKLSHSQVYLYLVSAVFAIIPFFNPKLFVISLLLSLIFEYLLELYGFSKLRGLKGIFVDYDLLKERHILFLILIWGEGIIITLSSIQSQDSPVDKILLPTILFLIIFSFFLRISEEYHFIEIDKDNRYLHEIMHIFFSLGTIILFASIGAIIIGDSNIHHSTSKILIIICLVLINTSHILFNKYELNKISQADNLNRYFKVDRILLYIQLIISVYLFFVNNKYVFVLLILLIFILHIGALPYRYSEYKKKLDEN